jgi:hypothetical protein
MKDPHSQALKNSRRTDSLAPRSAFLHSGILGRLST